MQDADLMNTAEVAAYLRLGQRKIYDLVRQRGDLIDQLLARDDAVDHAQFVRLVGADEAAGERLPHSERPPARLAQAEHGRLHRLVVDPEDQVADRGP